MKSKEEISRALEANLPAVPPPPFTPPSEEVLVKDTEDDYKYARTKLKGLIEKSEEALEVLMQLAHDAEHPRAFEVLSGMIKNTSDMTEQLLSLQGKRQKLVKPENTTPSVPGGSTTNNTIFVGSTSELQKFLRREKTVNASE